MTLRERVARALFRATLKTTAGAEYRADQLFDEDDKAREFCYILADAAIAAGATGAEWALAHGSTVRLVAVKEPAHRTLPPASCALEWKGPGGLEEKIRYRADL